MTWEVQWREVGSETLLGFASDIFPTQYELTGLDDDTDYEWRVRDLDGDWSAWEAFRTRRLMIRWDDYTSQAMPLNASWEGTSEYEGSSTPLNVTWKLPLVLKFFWKTEPTPGPVVLRFGQYEIVLLLPTPAPPEKVTPKGVRVRWEGQPGRSYKVTWEEEESPGVWIPKGQQDKIDRDFFDIPGLKENTKHRWKVEPEPTSPNENPPPEAPWEEFFTVDYRLHQYVGGVWTPRLLNLNVAAQWRVAPIYRYDAVAGNWVPL